MEVYFALNKTNGKAYVGWTKHTARKRFAVHCKAVRDGSPLYFHRAIRKYGADAFDVLTVYKGDDAEEMKQVECNYIAGMKTNDQRYGYNLTAGGEGFTGKHTEETKRKMVENRLPMTEECRQVRINTMKGLHSDSVFMGKRRDGMVGHSVSDDGRKNMSKAQRGHEVSAQQRQHISETLTGTKLSDEHKNKIRNARKEYLKDNPVTGLNSSLGGRKGSHTQWHVKRGIVKPECVYCQAGGY